MKDSFPDVSIIVVNYNGKKFLEGCFGSIEKINYPKEKYEVIMVDNSSSDDSVNYVKKNFPFVKILVLDKNYGFCKPNNEGAKIAKGEYLVFLNNDTVVTKNFLMELVKGVLSEEGVVSCGAKLLKPITINGKNLIDYAGGKISLDTLQMYEGMWDIDTLKYNSKKYTTFGCGACVIVEKKFFLDIGGFDEYYVAGFEERELGLRAWQYGYKVLYVPSSIVYHFRSGTPNMFFSPLWTELGPKNAYNFILKNFELKTVIKMLLLMHLMEVGKILFFLYLKRPSNIVALVKGYILLLKDIKNILNIIFHKRRIIQKNRKISDEKLFRLGLIARWTESLRYNIQVQKRMFMLKDVLKDYYETALKKCPQTKQ